MRNIDNLVTPTSICVGIDVHKYTHTAVALDAFGQTVGSKVFSNTTLSEFVVWLQALEKKKHLIVGIEDVNGYGYHVARKLVELHYLTYYVPPILTERERRQSAHNIKTDRLDAMRVGKVILTKSEQTLPAEMIVHQMPIIRTLDLLVQEQEDLVAQQTGIKNQLHALLHQYYGDSYKQEFADCFSRVAIGWYKQSLQDKENDFGITDISGLGQSISRRLDQLVFVQEQLRIITGQLQLHAKKHAGVQSLMKNLPGCGINSACRIIVEIGTIYRFATQEKLARYAGLAPVAKSSGQRARMYTDTGGNRKLNRAIHQVALSQIGRYGPEMAKGYHKRKQEEGKSKLWSMRCLKRHLSDKIFILLRNA